MYHFSLAVRSQSGRLQASQGVFSGGHMQRRECITLPGSAAFGGAAATGPLTVYGQQPDQMRRIGVRMAQAESDRDGQAFVADIP